MCILLAVLTLGAAEWVEIGRPSFVEPIFMLRHAPADLAALEATALAVSTPGSPRYGRHLTAAEAAAALPPQEGARAAVERFLEAHGATASWTASGDIAHARVPVDVAERMFGLDFALLSHPRASVQIARARSAGAAPLEAPVPAALRGHVYLVGNLMERPAVPHRLVHDVEVDETDSTVGTLGDDCGGCSGKVTPAVLRSRYGIPADTDVKATIATAEFQNVMYEPSALKLFQDKCKLSQAVQVDKQIGAEGALECHVPFVGAELCMEAVLDIEYAKAVVGDAPLTNIYAKDYSLLDWAKKVDDMGDDAPGVHSVSYGNDEVQQTSAAYMDSVNAQLAKLAAKGISVLFASGDQGVCGRSGCSQTYHPDFPASSPYVTAVGGTDFRTKGQIGEEVVWSQSGGGFSNVFPQPKWQADAVAGYLKAAKAQSVLPPFAAFNATGRAYPDVAALGGQQNPYCVGAPGLLGLRPAMLGVAGTSASCPVFAGVVARLNAARAAAKKPRLGWLNPWIYKNPQMFQDVTRGANGAGAEKGFPALAGWDPSSGFGTADFPKMLKAALAADGAEETLVV